MCKMSLAGELFKFVMLIENKISDLGSSCQKIKNQENGFNISPQIIR